MYTLYTERPTARRTWTWRAGRPAAADRTASGISGRSSSPAPRCGSTSFVFWTQEAGFTARFPLLLYSSSSPPRSLFAPIFFLPSSSIHTLRCKTLVSPTYGSGYRRTPPPLKIHRLLDWRFQEVTLVPTRRTYQTRVNTRVLYTREHNQRNGLARRRAARHDPGVERGMVAVHGARAETAPSGCEYGAHKCGDQ